MKLLKPGFAFAFVLLLSACTEKKFNAGDIYSVEKNDGNYGIVKVLVVEPDVIHLKIYKNEYTGRPSGIDTTELLMGKLGELGGLGIGHLPLQMETFKEWKPKKLTYQAIKEDELLGYRAWKKRKG
jgi:hypothetical protein